MSSTEFQNRVTALTADWANDVNDTVYDALGGAKTAAGVRTALGLGSLALQNANAVNLEGGLANGLVIGNVVPAAGTFTTLRTTQLAPVAANDVISKAWFDSRWGSLGPLLSFDPSAVAFTGGLMSGVEIQGGTLDGTPIGTTNPSTARFSSVQLQAELPVIYGGTGSVAYTGRYLVYTQTPTPHFEALAEIPLADIQGVGTMAAQDANAVGISGGNINGVTLGVGCVYQGLGGMATQQPNAVNITGGTLENVTLVGVTQSLSLATVVGATTLDHTKDVCIIDGSTSFIIDLPAAGLVTKPIFIKKIGEQRVDLRAPVSTTIDGSPLYNLFSDREAIILISDGTNYHVF